MKNPSIKTLITKLALALASIIICLVTVEASFRVNAYLKMSLLFEKKDKLSENIQNKGYILDTEYGSKIRPSKYKDIFFELKPLKQWDFKGSKVSINSKGFRDMEYPLEKSPGTLRIFGIGDSIMFGQGVPQEDNYLALIEAELNYRYPERKWEVINSGIPDYNPSAKVETLKHKGLKYRPDLVVMGTNTSDFDLPALVFFLGMPEERTLGRYFSVRHSFIAQYFKYIKKRDPFIIPDFTHKYVEMSGGKGVKKALKDLKRLSVIGDFPVVLFHLSNDTNINVRDIIKTANAYGIPTVDVSPAIQQYMKTQGIKDYFDSALTVSDGHPSSFTHKMAADTLLEYLENSGYIRMLLSKDPGPASR